ncbi:unnamed protein product, partial [Clonostachys rhizophaga]
PLTPRKAWDQGAASVISTLPSFQKQFDLTSGAAASQIRDIVSFVYLGQAAGSALSFLINDRIGRLWSYRLYLSIYIVASMVATFTPGWAGLYASRIISGIAIGALSVSGPVTLSEISPSEIRGLLSAWFVVAMGAGLVGGVFCAYGTYLNMPVIRLQYQVVWFVPAILMAVLIIASFFIRESPRWLIMVDRYEEGVKALVALRGLPLEHPRVQEELNGMKEDLARSRGRSLRVSILKETFTVASNLRRLQQTLISFAFAQLSGANSVTSYFVPIMGIVGLGGDETRSIFLSGMYGVSKLGFTLLASFFFVDLLGRRKSLFVGIIAQLLSHIYIGVFMKVHQDGSANEHASQAATAALFIHAFGYAVGLMILSYIFGSELWPNRIRSFGACLSQTFHWLLIYGVKFSIPSLLKATNSWGAFIFFAGWCALALGYVYVMVPETSNMSVEQINEVFEGPWFNAYKRAKYITGKPSPDAEANFQTSLDGKDPLEEEVHERESINARPKPKESDD